MGTGKGMVLMSTLLNEVRVAARSLTRARGFTALAVLMLAVGIGANTAIFSAVDGVLLRPLDFPQPDRLVGVWHTAPGFGFDRIPLAPDTYAMIREDNQVFAEIAALRPGSTVNLTGNRDPVVLEATEVSRELMGVLGLSPELGRNFTLEEDTPGGPEAVLLGHGLWRREFGADPTVVGSTVTPGRDCDDRGRRASRAVGLPQPRRGSVDADPDRRERPGHRDVRHERDCAARG